MPVAMFTLRYTLYTYMSNLEFSRNHALATYGKSKAWTNDAGEVRELTEEDFERALPIPALPDSLKDLLSSSERTVASDAEPRKWKRTAA
jgi:hypothetical protein